MAEGNPTESAGDAQDGERAALYQKLGRCLVRLQQVELVLKWLSSQSYLEAPAAEFAEEHAHRADGIANHTLGTVKGAVLKRLIVDDVGAPPTPDLDDSAPVYFGFGLVIGGDPDARAVLSARLEDLVKRRNLIIHGLLTEFDLDTDAGRAAAELYLDETLAGAESVRALVRLWVESAMELGETLNQPEMLARLFPESNDPQ